MLGKELSLDDILKQVDEEMAKEERDFPKLHRLWSQQAYFDDRRKKISSLKAGQVKELVAAYPLLHHVEFVSIGVRTVMYI